MMFKIGDLVKCISWWRTDQIGIIVPPLNNELYVIVFMNGTLVKFLFGELQILNRSNEKI